MGYVGLLPPSVAGQAIAGRGRRLRQQESAPAAHLTMKGVHSTVTLDITCCALAHTAP